MFIKHRMDGKHIADKHFKIALSNSKSVVQNF